MSQKINQLCENIAKHPSKINMLNDALSLALKERHPECFKPIVELLVKLKHNQTIKEFVQLKVQIVFLSLIQVALQNPQQFTFKLLGQSFQLSDQKTTLIKQFLQTTAERDIDWSWEWPSVIISECCEYIYGQIQKQQSIDLSQIVGFIVNTPHMNDIQSSEQNKIMFKKRFQALLLSILGHSTIARQLLFTLYHNLGDKIMSKLSNPLILSNHCISRFVNDPQLQIQILACLFVLVGKYGLQLEQFYPKLQTLVKYRQNSRSVYQLPNSRRFFKLLEAALRSSRVPFKTVSNFAHLLITQLPGQNSQFAFWSLSFIVNLTKKHRKLLDQLPSLPEIKLLKYHYSPKIRVLVQQLSKNLNKTDYLEIEQFGKVNCEAIAAHKLASVIESLQNDQLQFKIPIFQDPI